MKALKTLLFSFILVFTLNASSQTVYTTKTGAKYHKKNCRYLKYSKKGMTLEKAKSLGYMACLVCKPTKNTIKKDKVGERSLISDKKRNTVREESKATQCTGKTKSGSRCKRKTKNTNGRCYQH
ncbi:hypothetical protein [Flavivirga algicola]|uniref:Uncharacterized protein n=1 Tax=Flavivirga algicola TaxID=2729136 RepID=A0ABX1RVS6_9FLAO|nr:hypothetical protein [Flavivirga algicola]NMH87659.1 hypothetical protein [Flavivirga algicola]